jgi:hypothetical protein
MLHNNIRIGGGTKMKAITAIITALLLAAVIVSAKPAGMTAEQFREYRGYDTDRPGLYCPLRAPTENRLGSVGTWGALSDGTWLCGNWGDIEPKKGLVEAVNEPEEPVCTDTKTECDPPVCVPGHLEWNCKHWFHGRCTFWTPVWVSGHCEEPVCHTVPDC